MQWLKPSEVTEPGWYLITNIGDTWFIPESKEVYVNEQYKQIRIRLDNYAPQVKDLHPDYRLMGPITKPTE